MIRSNEICSQRRDMATGFGVILTGQLFEVPAPGQLPGIVGCVRRCVHPMCYGIQGTGYYPERSRPFARWERKSRTLLESKE